MTLFPESCAVTPLLGPSPVAEPAVPLGPSPPGRFGSPGVPLPDVPPSIRPVHADGTSRSATPTRRRGNRRLSGAWLRDQSPPAPLVPRDDWLLLNREMFIADTGGSDAGRSALPTLQMYSALRGGRTNPTRPPLSGYLGIAWVLGICLCSKSTPMREQDDAWKAGPAHEQTIMSCSFFPK